MKVKIKTNQVQNLIGILTVLRCIFGPNLVILAWTADELWGGQAIRLEGPEDPHRRNSRFLRSRDHAHASIPLAQTPWGLTGRAWLQAGAQRVVMVVSHH